MEGIQIRIAFAGNELTASEDHAANCGTCQQNDGYSAQEMGIACGRYRFGCKQKKRLKSTQGKRYNGGCRSHSQSFDAVCVEAYISPAILASGLERFHGDWKCTVADTPPTVPSPGLGR